MKYNLILLFLFHFLICLATPKDSIRIVKKKEIYSLNGQCNDSILWEEVCMKNVFVQSKINSDIYSLIQSFKIDSINFEDICTGDIIDEESSNIVYAKNNIVSIFFRHHFIYPNIESSTYIRTLNYSIKTGDTITFQELFKLTKYETV